MTESDQFAPQKPCSTLASPSGEAEQFARAGQSLITQKRDRHISVSFFLGRWHAWRVRVVPFTSVFMGQTNWGQAQSNLTANQPTEFMPLFFIPAPTDS